jgi:hypothetical protein
MKSQSHKQIVWVASKCVCERACVLPRAVHVFSLHPRAFVAAARALWREARIGEREKKREQNHSCMSFSFMSSKVKLKSPL